MTFQSDTHTPTYTDTHTRTRINALLLGLAISPAVVMAIVVLVQGSQLSLRRPAPIKVNRVAVVVSVPRPVIALQQRVARAQQDRVALENSARSNALSTGWIGVALVLLLGLGLAWALSRSLSAAAAADPGGGRPPAAEPPVGAAAASEPRAATTAAAEPQTDGAGGPAARDREVLVRACVELSDSLTSEALSRRLRDALHRAGVQAVLVDEGAAFDATHARIVDRVPTDDPALDNRVAGTERPGYVDRGRILRVPEVMVYKLEGGSRG